MILDTKDFIKKLNEQLIENIKDKPWRPLLYLLKASDDNSSESFRKSIIKQAEKVGVEVKIKDFDIDSSQDEIIAYIEKLNQYDKVDGILFFSPLDKKYDQRAIFNKISPEKDVDGLNIESFSKLLWKKDYKNLPTTALSTLEYLKSITDLEGKDVLVINRSMIIGKPLIHMLLNEDASVQVCHSKSKDLYEKISKADIIISAIGRGKSIKTKDFKEGAIVIDLAYDMIDGKFYGDFDSEGFEDMNINYLPSIAGIGRINANMILRNTYRNGVENDRK